MALARALNGMKLGAENKKKAGLAIGLAVVAVILLARTFLSSPETPATSQVPAAPVAQAQPAAKRSAPRDSRERHIAAVWTPTLDPRLRLDLLAGSEGRRYQGTGRNIFREHTESALEAIPKPLAPGLKTTAAKPKPAPWRPAGPPPPPPINLRFHGWASHPGQAKAVFLAQGSDVFVAHEGDIVARRYKVMRIGANSVEIQDVLSNNTQTIPMS